MPAAGPIGWAFRHPSACLPSLLLCLLTLFYLVGPIDLIPGATPVFGHVDEAGVLVIGLAAAWMLLPAKLRGGLPLHGELHGGLRAVVLRTLARLGGGPTLRLCLGRWPTVDERRSFASGFVQGPRVVPPILRGLDAVPASKEPVGRLAVLNLLREGRVAPPPVSALMGPAHYPWGNPLSYRTEPPIAFLHLEKTAGLTVVSALTETVHPFQINDDPQRDMPPHIRAPFVGRGMQSARAANLVWGHYDLPSIRRLGDRRMVFTFLREPRARLLSQYRFWRAVDPRFIADGIGSANVRAAHENDLLAFLRTRDPMVRDYIDSFYVRRLTGLYLTGADRDPVEVDEAGALAAARDALATLDFVGVTERLDQSVALLSETIGTPLAIGARSNDTATNHLARGALFRPCERNVLTAEIEAELAHAVRLDQVLYEQAAAGLGARLARERKDGARG